jgi:hypothetical protein
MTPRLDLARATEIAGVHAKARKRVLPGYEQVIRQDRPEFEGEGVERSVELLRLEDERRGKTGVVPASDARSAGPEVLRTEVVDDGERRSWRSCWGVCRPVRHQ